ncbi:MAG TPA: SDR family oxidoreductase [Longimicrobiales bacterium]|nr:SDR family oxidoreductase [Longimicrobiales bacterium]
MRYLVTGGAGFIGSHLAEYLVGRGEEVVVLDDFSTGRRENLDGFRDKIELVEGSMLDAGVCARAVSGVDYVLHEAAIPSVPRSVADPLGSHAANATGTLNVLMAARDAKVKKVVYAASSSAYGDTDELPKRETMFPRPLSPYAVAKFTGEAYCRAFYATYGLPTVALRYFNIFGPRQDPDSQYAAAVAKFVSCALGNAAPTIYGDGEQSRDFTYVANAVEANMRACEAPAEANGDVFNVGCGDRITVNELWRRIAATVGSTAQPNYTERRAGDVRDSLASLEKISRVVGYKPVVSLEDGLKKTIEYLRGENK